MNNKISLDECNADNKQTEYEKSFCLIWLLVFLYMIIRPITNNATLIRIIWIPSLLLLFFVSFRTRITKRYFVEILTPILIIAFSIISQSGALDQDHLLAGFCYINMFVVLNASMNIKPQKKTFDYIFYISVALSFLFFFYTFTPIAHRVHTNDVVWESKYLVYDLGNSNLAAMFIFSFYCVLLINLAYRKKKVLIVLLMVADIYMMYGTNCRSVMVSVVLVTLSYFFVGKRKIPKLLLYICELFPVIFAVVYLILYNQMGTQSVYFMEKSLFSGRQDNFLGRIESIDSIDTLLFGNFAREALQNAHNIDISVLASLGIVGMISFHSFFFRTTTHIVNQEITAVRNMSIICILGFFIQSSMEAAFFLGGFPGVIFLSTFMMLSNYNDYSLKDHEKSTEYLAN